MNNDISLSRKRGTVTGFFGFNNDILQIMKEDVGLKMPLSTLKLLQSLFYHKERRLPTLDELYLLDALADNCGIAAVGISRFETESRLIADIYADIMNKYATLPDRSSIPSPATLASVMRKYCESVGKSLPRISAATGILPSARAALGGAVKFAKTGTSSAGILATRRRSAKAGDILVLLGKGENMTDSEFDSIASHLILGSSSKYITNGRVVGEQGIAIAVAEFCKGANIDMSALPSITPPYEADLLATAATGHIVISLEQDGVRSLLEAASAHKLYSAVLGNITSDSRLTVRREYSPAISLLMSTIKQTLVPPPQIYSIKAPMRQCGDISVETAYCSESKLLLASASANSGSPFFCGYDTVLSAVSAAVAAGGDYKNTLLTLNTELPNRQDINAYENALCILLGAYRAQIEFYLADNANILSISPNGIARITAAAVCTNIEHPTPPLPEKDSAYLYLLSPDILDDGQLDLHSLRDIWNKIALLRREGVLCSATAAGGKCPSDILRKQTGFTPNVDSSHLLNTIASPASIIVGTSTAIDGVLIGSVTQI